MGVAVWFAQGWGCPQEGKDKSLGQLWGADLLQHISEHSYVQVYNNKHNKVRKEKGCEKTCIKNMYF